jgi:aminoglycoside 3-N-acetyltransferase
MKTNLFHNQLGVDLLKLGVRPGGVLLVHSALKGFGSTVPGGAGSVIQGIRAALGPEGTLLLPGLSYKTVRSANPVFDIQNTPSCVGLIPETFRKLPGVLRSVHPTHSVCGIGPLAGEILGGHAKDATPCGPNSPFHLLRKYEGQILMLGCGLKPNTSLHAIEETEIPPYLFAESYPITITSGNNEPYSKTYTPHNFKNTIQRYERVQEILSWPDLRVGPVVNSFSHLIETQALWRKATQKLKRYPLFFVDIHE